MEQKDYVQYDYKSISVTRDYAPLYIDCLQNFGWSLLEERTDGTLSYTISHSDAPVEGIVHPIPSAAAKTDDIGTVTLSFKRSSSLSNKLQIDRLERQCQEALNEIRRIERRNNAKSMSLSLGAGIVGTILLSAAVYSFIVANITLGLLFATIGIAGWVFGFFSNLKMGKRESSAAAIQEQLEEAHKSCEQAQGLLV